MSGDCIRGYYLHKRILILMNNICIDAVLKIWFKSFSERPYWVYWLLTVFIGGPISTCSLHTINTVIFWDSYDVK